jgi:hypothetical protein
MKVIKKIEQFETKKPLPYQKVVLIKYHKLHGFYIIPSALTKYFRATRIIIKTKIPIPNLIKSFVDFLSFGCIV